MDSRYGTVLGFTISDLHRLYPSFFSNHHLVVTALDSSQDVRSFISQNSRGEQIALQFFGRAAVIAPRDASKFFKGNFLHAFDEMYLVPEHALKQIEIEWTEQFTSDCVIFEEGLPRFVSDAMVLLNATRFVSDGLGLNYLCENPAIEASIFEKLAVTGI